MRTFLSCPIHWVSANHALDAEIRLYDRLFSVPDPNKVQEGKEFTENINAQSLEVINAAKVEAFLKDAKPGSGFQFERQGYFCVDKDSKPGALVFNRTVALRDSWAKIEGKSK